MAEREHILADFQACTGNEDIEECIAILDSFEWNLMEAVHGAMANLDTPSEVVGNPIIGLPSGPPPPAYSEIESNLDTGDLERAILQGHKISPPPEYQQLDTFGSGASGSTSFGSNTVFPSTSSGSSPRPSRIINFTIEYKDRSIKLVLQDTDTVGRIKELLNADTSIPVTQMQLRGWMTKSDRVIDDTDVLNELKLPKENVLFLLTTDGIPFTNTHPNNGEDPHILERLAQDFTLNIRFKDMEKNYSLNFKGSKTIQEVKGDVFALIDVPVRYQKWSGWPDGAEDGTMTLAGSGIGYPCHNLEVQSTRPNVEAFAGASHKHTNEGSKKRHKDESDESSNESDPMDVDGISDEEYEDAHDNISLDDEMFANDSDGIRKAEPLMPENAADEVTALEQFTHEFAARYGECHPHFYTGSLQESIKDALQCGARDRKLLAIYLHHDNSILSNVFCSQVLCSESIVTFLSNNFITWAWDLTSEINKARLLTMCTQHFGSVAATTVRNFKKDELPLLLVISRNRGSNEVVNVIRANVTIDELMTQLIQVHEVFQSQQRTEIVEEEERDARETMKREQDQAYLESLAVDKEKAEVKKREEEEKREIERQIEFAKEQEELVKLKEDEEKEAIRQSVADQLPAEPSSVCEKPISIIRFRTPGGEMITRRFLAQNCLDVLLKFVITKGFPLEEFKVLTTYPRKDLTQEDPQKTLEEMKLFPQETVILEER